MSTHTAVDAPVEPALEPPRGGHLAGLGRWAGTHLRTVLIGWIVVIAVFGAFAPRVESALAGAGWEASGSPSVAARTIIRHDFAGLGSSALQVVVHDQRGAIAQDPAARRAVTAAEHLLAANPHVRGVVAPQPGLTLSRDGRTALIQAGAAAGTNTMVTAATKLTGPIGRLSSAGVRVALTGDSALWSDFNSANRSAMLRSEMLSWPITLLVLVLAFGSLVAAGLPLMLTMVGLLVAAGALVLATTIAPVSIWALNFALMFALALGIDYSLFLVVRFRAALDRRAVVPGDRAAAVAAVAETMGTAGKAIAFSGLTVLASLSSVLLVPSPAFRSMALGIMLSVIAVLAATLTLLPAVLASLGTRIDSARIRMPRFGRPPRTQPRPRYGAGMERRLHGWGELLWRRPLISGALALAALAAVIVPVFGLRTSMPSISIIPPTASARVGYDAVSRAFGPGMPGALQVLVPAADQPAAAATLSHLPGVAAAMPGPSSHGWTLDLVVPTSGPSTRATGATIDRLRTVLPRGSLVGGAAAENHDLQQALASRTPIVFAILLALGFLLLLVALGSPLVALGGVLATGLSVAGAFGIARLIFQDGWLHGLLHFQPQGFVDAWGPIFFGAMVSGVAMDYTLFLLSAAKEHYETGRHPQQAMVHAVRSSGRVVVAAALIMIAVFLTFALSGPLAPKEMGVILAAAVALDALVVRMVLIPVLLRLAGHAAWHQTRWLARVLPRVTFSH